MSNSVSLATGNTVIQGTFTVTGSITAPTYLVSTEINWLNPQSQVPVWGAGTGTLAASMTSVAAGAPIVFSSIVNLSRVANISGSALQVILGGLYQVFVTVAGGTSWTLHINEQPLADAVASAPAGQTCALVINVALAHLDTVSVVNSGGTTAQITGAMFTIAQVGALPHS